METLRIGGAERCYVGTTFMDRWLRMDQLSRNIRTVLERASELLDAGADKVRLRRSTTKTVNERIDERIAAWTGVASRASGPGYRGRDVGQRRYVS